MNNRLPRIFAGSILAAGAAYAAINPGLLRAELIRFSSMQRLEKGLYVQPDLPPQHRLRLAADVSAARQRVKEFWAIARPIRF